MAGRGSAKFSAACCEGYLPYSFGGVASARLSLASETFGFCESAFRKRKVRSTLAAF